MVVRLASLRDVAHRFDAVVLDQWGVLHDGTTPYATAVQTVAALHLAGMRLAVLSNSGKRAAPNRARIASMGFAPDLFELVMTSGEALWRDIHHGSVPERVFCAVESAAGDARIWADGLPITLVDTPAGADAILLMGLPDQGIDAAGALMDHAFRRGLPVYCTNPDRASPRAGGVTVTSPGALAQDYAARGGRVKFYGKPHLPVFTAVATALRVAPHRLLMVGDSLEHDMAGGAAAGWATAFIEGGVHADSFTAAPDPIKSVTDLCRSHGCPLPDFTLPTLR